MKILVVKPDAIGDLVLSTPVYKALKNHYKDSHLTLFAKSFAKDLLWGNPHIDAFTTEADFIGYDLVVHLFKDPGYILKSFLSGCKIRAGEGSSFPQSLLLTHKAKTHNNIMLHQVERNLKILEPLGILTPDASLDLFLDKSEDYDISGNPLIAISIGHAGFNNKYWTAGGFKKTAVMFHDKFKAKIVLLGSQNEVEISKEISAPVENLVGKLSIKQLVNVISKCDLHISGDTGPLHIAAALKVPSVAMFTTKDHKPLRWGPWRTKHIVIRKPTACIDKCVPGNCAKDTCSLEITPDEVFSAAEDVLHGRNLSDPVDWIRKSLNILCLNKKARDILLPSGFNVYTTLPSCDLVKFIIEKDINILHLNRFDINAYVSAVIASNILGSRPLVIFGSNEFDGLDSLLKYYAGKFKAL